MSRKKPVTSASSLVMSLASVRKEMRELGDPNIAEHSQRFFKTAPGEYAAGDQFLGIRVPTVRRVAKQFAALSLNQTTELLRVGWHEERLLALLIMVQQFTRGDEKLRKQIYGAYMEHLAYVNNWDLVDSSAPYLVGEYLSERKRQELYRLARSTCLWSRRVAMIATLSFIKRGDFTDTLAIATLLLNDEEDLIHKASGWMLREVGKRDVVTLRTFLNVHSPQMPRTTLRYAIERLPEPQRQAYLNRRASLQD